MWRQWWRKYSHLPPGSCACILLYPNRTLALSESDKSHLLPDDLTTNFTLRSFACMHTQVTDQPYPCIFIQFSAKISTGFQESGCCKTLSLLSSPFVQFHFKAITGNNRNNQTFIPCKTRSPPKNKLSILQQKWVATKKKKKDNLGFVSPSGVKRIKPRLTLFSILGGYITSIFVQRRITFGIRNTSFIWGGCKVVPLSWSSPERFLLCQPYKMSRNAPAKKYKSHDDFQTSCQRTKLESKRSVNIMSCTYLYGRIVCVVDLKSFCYINTRLWFLQKNVKKIFSYGTNALLLCLWLHYFEG